MDVTCVVMSLHSFNSANVTCSQSASHFWGSPQKGNVLEDSDSKHKQRKFLVIALKSEQNCFKEIWKAVCELLYVEARTGTQEREDGQKQI